MKVVIAGNTFEPAAESENPPYESKKSEFLIGILTLLV